MRWLVDLAVSMTAIAAPQTPVDEARTTASVVSSPLSLAAIGQKQSLARTLGLRCSCGSQGHDHFVPGHAAVV